MPERDREHAEEAEAERAPVAAPAGPATPVGRVLDMQRGMGNAAVARMLAARAGPVIARDPVDAGVPPVAGVPPQGHIDVVEPRPGDVADMDRAIREHFSNEDWQGAARVLNGFNQLDIDTRVRGYGIGERTSLIEGAAVNGAAADRIRKVAQFENAIFFRQFEAATRALAGYPDTTRVDPRLHEGLGLYDIAFMLHYAERLNLVVVSLNARPMLEARSGEIAVLAEHAIVTGDWNGAAVLLNATVDADLTARIASPPRTPPQLFDLNRASDALAVTRVHAALGQAPTAGLIQTEGLDRSLRDQIAAADWPGVAATLGRYNNDAERTARLQWFHLDQVTALATHLRGGAVGVSANPVYPLVEARRIEKLGQDYTAAIGASNWASVITLLNAYNDTDLLPKAREIQTAKGAAGVTAAANLARVVWMGDDNNRVRRVLAFLPLEAQTGAAARPAANAGMTNGPAAAGGGTAVGGGTVNAYENATDSSGQAGWFGFDYTGPQAQQTGWIQFLAREAEKFGSDGSSQGFVDAETHAMGQDEARRWGSPSSPYWTLDTLSDAAPFYETPSVAAHGTAAPAGTAGANTASPTQTTMYDSPAINAVVAAKAFDTWFWEDDVDHLEMRFKFHDYLVRGNEVLYENTMTVTFVLTSASATPAPRNRAGAGHAASRMRTPHYQALVRRFPAWSFYNHG